METAHLCGIMAEEMGLDIRAAQRSGLIHDIGKVLWAETEAVGLSCSERCGLRARAR